MTEILQKRVIQPILGLLTQGITPEKIAMSVVFGVALGIFPVLGSTTALCALAAVIFRLNLPAIQIVNYFVYPLQLVLIVPFMRMGARVFGGAAVGLSLTQMLEMLRADRMHAFKALWVVAVQGVGVWSVVVPPVCMMGYLALVWALKRADARRGPAAITTAVLELP